MSRRWFMVLAGSCLAALGSAQTSGTSWTPGEVGRLVAAANVPVAFVSPTAEGAFDFARTTEFIRRSKPIPRDPKTKQGEDPMRIVPANLRAGILQTYVRSVDLDGKGDEATLTVAAVRIVEGPLKGTIWFTTDFVGHGEFMRGERVLLAPKLNSAAGAFAVEDLSSYFKADYEGNTSTTSALTTLQRVFLMPRGTKAHIEAPSDSNVVVRVRLDSGPAGGKLLYVMCEELRMDDAESKKAYPAIVKAYGVPVAKVSEGATVHDVKFAVEPTDGYFFGTKHKRGDVPAVVDWAEPSTFLVSGSRVEAMRVRREGDYVSVTTWDDVKKFLREHPTNYVDLKCSRPDGSKYDMYMRVDNTTLDP